MSAQPATRIEYCGNIQVHHPAKPKPKGAR